MISIKRFKLFRKFKHKISLGIEKQFFNSCFAIIYSCTTLTNHSRQKSKKREQKYIGIKCNREKKILMEIKLNYREKICSHFYLQSLHVIIHIINGH